MENELLNQLGINWKLLLSQAANFFILLALLTFLVYKPVIKIIKARSAKIKEGLDKAEEASVRLNEVDAIGKKRIKQAEETSIGIINETKQKAKILEQELQRRAEEKNAHMQKELQASFIKQQEEAKERVLRGAAEIIKKTLVKTVELKPEAIDEALIKKAASQIKDEK